VVWVRSLELLCPQYVAYKLQALENPFLALLIGRVEISLDADNTVWGNQS
jgi:hypothetical protein